MGRDGGHYGPSGGGDSFRDVEKERKRLKKERKELDRRDRKRSSKKHSKKRRRRSRSRSSSSRSRSRSRSRSSSRGAKRRRAAPAPLPAAAAYAPPPPRPAACAPVAGSFLSSLAAFTRRPAAPAPSAFSTTRAGGHEQANYLRCAACGVDSSSEKAFAQHIEGKAHRKRNRGRAGFAGLAPNEAGGIPRLCDPRLRAAAAAVGYDPDAYVEPTKSAAPVGVFPGGAALYDRGGGPWAPPLQVVGVGAAAAASVRSRLNALVEDVDGDSDGDGDGPGARNGRRGGRASSILTLPPAPPRGDPHGATRRSLPVFEYRQRLLDAAAALTPEAPCLLVEGETGSGKSTQVPQYILEDAAARGVVANVLVTQPRRIAAIGVADRIAAERGETVGEVVGYAIRGEARACERTALLFNTTGVCLRRLQEDGLAGVTHVVVDEVHERTLEADFLLLALRELVRLRNARGEPPLKILLMSATMPGEAVRGYFGQGCVTVKFPGRAFPVEPLFLEHALALTRHVVRGGADWHRTSQASERRAKRLADMSRDGGRMPLSVVPRDPRELARRFGNWPPSVLRALEDADEACLNVDLVCELVDWFAVRCGGDVDAAVADARASLGGASRDAPAPGGGGLAVLVFVVGVKEIEDVLTALRASGRFDPRWLLPLHGALPPDEQRRVFESPPPGTTKVVVATNVAETSITIPDVAFVVDAGRVKEERYDATRHMASLDDVYVSAASAKQRRGRAGRVRPGLAVHLFPRDAPLEAHAEPEVRRVALEQLVLRLKALPEGVVPGRTAAEACAALPEPPEPAAVARAASGLVAIGALTAREAADDDEQLTELGALLARLPVDARLGKLVVLAACFDGCLDDALTIAAALGNRSPFLSPMERREEADASKRGFVPRHANTQDGCEASDLLCVRNAYKTFDSLGPRKFDFARDRFLSIKTLQAIGALKRQLLEALHFAGLVAGPGLRARDVEMLGRRHGDSDGVQLALDGARARPSAAAPPSDALLAALLAAALFPQLAYVSKPISKKTKLPCAAENIKLLVRDPDGDKAEPQVAHVHPSSVAARLGGASWVSPFAVFHERVRTTKVYVRDCTPVPPLAPFLLSGNKLELDNGTLLLDGWLKCGTEPRNAADLALHLREKIDARVSGLLKGDLASPDDGDLRHCLETMCAVTALPEPKEPKRQQAAAGGGGTRRAKKRPANRSRRGGRGRARGGYW